MKILQSLLVVLFALFTQMSHAGSFIDSASVVSVDKVYKQVRVEEPYQECYIKETVQNNGDGSATNEIIGGVIGGAIGNFYDRLIYNAVPDFIDLHYNNFHWFTFNIADIFITIGVIFFLMKGYLIKNLTND